MAIATWKTIVSMGLIGVPGLEHVIEMIMHMMIMITGLAIPAKIGRTAVRGIMNMVDIVMIQTMREAIKEREIGGGAIPVIENVIREV